MRKSVIKKVLIIFIFLILIISFLLFFLTNKYDGQYSSMIKHQSSQKLHQRTSTEDVNNESMSHIHEGISEDKKVKDDPRYHTIVGPDGNPNDKPPTQTAWVDPNGGGYFTGDGPFDIMDANGVHHWVDPVASGWTKTTYDDITKNTTK